MRKIITALTLIAILLTACQNEPDEKSKVKDMKAQLTIAYTAAELFEQDYGQYFRLKYPNIEIRPVQFVYYSRGISIDKFIELNKPDILLLREEDYKRLYEEGKLLNLEPLLKRDQYNMDTYLPMIQNRLRATTGGELHGLAPGFSSMALFYNKTLLDQAGVPYPTDQMTWKELFLLAQRFQAAASEDQYGLLFRQTNLFNVATATSRAIGMEPIEEETASSLYMAPEWKQHWETIIEGYKNQAFVLEPWKDGPPVYGEKNLFAQGKVGMYLGHPFTVQELTDAPFEWDVVTAPVSEQDRDHLNVISLSQIFVILNTTKEKDAAWELLKFMNSDEMAKQHSRTVQSDVPSRPQYAAEHAAYNMEAYYKLAPGDAVPSFKSKLPEAFHVKYYEAGSTIINKAAEGQVTVDEAITEMHETTERLLREFPRSEE